MFGLRLKDLRESRGLSQQQLADKLNVSRATISSWETSRTEPNLGQIEQLAKIFNCTKTRIIDGADQVDYALTLEDDEILIIEAYRKLSAADKLLVYAQMISKLQGDSPSKPF